MIRVACIALALLFAGCTEDDDAFEVDVVAVASGPLTATVDIRNVGDGDVHITSCDFDVYAQIERWDGSGWTPAGEPCEPQPDGGIGISEGTAYAFEIDVPGPGNYRFAVEVGSSGPSEPVEPQTRLARSNTVSF